MTQWLRQVKRLHYHESPSFPSTASRMRAVPATAAVDEWELRYIDVEQAYLQADIDEEIYIELLKDYHAFTKAVGLLRKVIYGLVPTGLCCFRTFTHDIKKKCCWQAKQRRMRNGLCQTSVHSSRLRTEVDRNSI